MQFCTGVDIRDVVTPANFGSHRFMLFRMAGVEFQVFPFGAHTDKLVAIWRCCQNHSFRKIQDRGIVDISWLADTE